MTDIPRDLDAILRAIDHLPEDDREQVRRYIETRQPTPHPRSKAEVAGWTEKLDAAIAELREGLTDEELAEIIAAMNAE